MLYLITHLNQEDLESLHEAVRSEKLPKLKILDLSHSILTSFLKDLLGGPNHPGFPSLEILDLLDTHLNQEDVESLGEAVRVGKLPQLKMLELWGNTLTGCLKDIFGGPNHPGFPSLEVLDLRKTHLNREDVESLSEAVWAGKLPQLKVLNLDCNDLSHMEREVDDLIAACDVHCEKWVELQLRGTGQSQEFRQGCRDKYCRVEIKWR